MRKQLQNLSFRRSILALVLLLLLTNVVSIGLVMTSSNSKTQEVALVSKNQALSQQISVLLMQYVAGDEDAGIQCAVKARQYAENLKLVKEGGAVAGTTLVMTPAEGSVRKPIEQAMSDIIEIQRNLDSLWTIDRTYDSTYYETVINENITDTGIFYDTVDVEHSLKVSNPEIYAAGASVNEKVFGLTRADAEITELYLAAIDAGKARLNFWLWILLGFAVVLTIFVYLLVRLGWHKPMRHVRRQLDAISKGNYGNQVAFVGRSELGKLGSSVNSLGRKLEKVASFVNAFRQGRLDHSEAVFEDSEFYSDDTFIQDLLETQKQLRKSAEENDKRLWINKGFAKFGDILQSTTDDVEALSRNVISNLVKHLEINQGGIFILEGEDAGDPFLELKASYAYDREKFVQKRIGIGVGLIGACYLEKQTTYLTEVPDDYAFIRSGVGAAVPKCLLLVPLLVNGECLGVLELGAFTVLEPQEVEFVEQLAENIASTISNVRINARTLALYEQSQSQAELMKSQEEEMRQNLEELHATQEEMVRKEREYLDRIRELEEGQAEAEQS